MARGDPKGSDHWSHEVIPLVLAALAMFALIFIFVSFLHADW